ncbi:MAG: sugar O-acetyltransferase [Levilactobacillus sp.]|jgi:acetyltransferase-like isoleucine patch superfamily enzyme|uniref:DapH/DapD/GlmU-related protein n=1 Tax=Levilactobacillus sp. TaxID=2767919 RepID=UPI0025840F9B|nr:DapH/DapD/GlmU-related protein [Levilactobacillus sp.]MCI1553464.1 sugar O-acetyltransferase [Levilactobacillus sp.]MCI1597853.1 sugar O-acetyltransferase [Levilactobacillus sp.]MCI1605651.1 sugar O-acetyltransferase [Levilactobacillus sp.]
MTEPTIFQRALAGLPLDFNGADFQEIQRTVQRTQSLLKRFNNQDQTPEQRRATLSQVVGYEVPASAEVNAPVHSDFGPHIFIGEDVYVNQDVMFTDLGGIYLERGALIGPRAMLITVNHLEDPTHRRDVQAKAIHVEANAWIGAGSVILPGVTVGENAIVGAGAIVTKDVPANTVVVGSPARVLRRIKGMSTD